MHLVTVMIMTNTLISDELSMLDLFLKSRILLLSLKQDMKYG